MRFQARKKFRLCGGRVAAFRGRVAIGRMLRTWCGAGSGYRRMTSAMIHAQATMAVATSHAGGADEEAERVVVRAECRSGGSGPPGVVEQDGQHCGGDGCGDHAEVHLGSVSPGG